MTAQALALSAISYSYPYTVTTPTTYWRAPTFATPMPLPRCSESVCPALNGQECQDVAGNKYGILCNTLLSGIVITNSGRKFLRQKERRSCECGPNTIYLSPVADLASPRQTRPLSKAALRFVMLTAYLTVKVCSITMGSVWRTILSQARSRILPEDS